MHFFLCLVGLNILDNNYKYYKYNKSINLINYYKSYKFLLRWAERVWPRSVRSGAETEELGDAKPRGRGLGQRNIDC